jgi:phage terminase large subunit
MPINDSGRWYPDLFPKQLDVFNSYSRALLVSGPRLSGKTVAVLHRIVKHLWETPNARVGMFSRVMKNAKDAGSWKLLISNIIPKWINAGMGMEFTTMGMDGVPGPKVDGQTRTPYFRLKNAYGGESELMLFSLDDDNEIESKLKEREFSMIYFSELDNFGDRKVLSVALLSLRLEHLKYGQMMWIADTNPSDEGESCWIYKVFYKERAQSYDDYKTDQQDVGLTSEEMMSAEEFGEHQKSLELIEIMPEDNHFLDPKQLAELKRTYSYDIGLYSRYVLGKWVYGDGDKSRHFRSFFKPNIHVIGSCDDPDEDKWELAIPSPNCVELVTGFDLGETNHAAAVMEKMLLDQYVPHTKQTIKRAHFTLLDEQVVIKQDFSIEAFTETFMELIYALETHIGRQVGLDNSWSDQSAIVKYSSTADTYPYLQVYAASGNRIFLKGVAKGPGSVKVRVQLMKQLLAQNRFKISAHCHHTIKMLKDLKRGKDAVNFVVPDENKHIFDAITYALLKECEEELLNMPSALTGQRKSIALSIK